MFAELPPVFGVGLSVFSILGDGQVLVFGTVRPCHGPLAGSSHDDALSLVLPSAFIPKSHISIFLLQSVLGFKRI